MTAPDNEAPDNDGWVPCKKPADGDVIRWTEPLWAAPTKPRGKPDQIGQQRLTALVIASGGDSIEMEVQSVERLSLNEGVKDTARVINAGDFVRRKKTSLRLGSCCKQA